MTAYVGTGDLATFLGVAANTLTTALADLAVSAAQQRVRKELNQVLTYVTNDVIYLDGNGRTKLRLPERPVRRVVSVEEGINDPTWVTLASTAYLLRGSTLVRWDGWVWTPGDANVRVTYDHGWNLGQIDSDTSDSDYDTTVNNLPADIILVTLSLARRMYEAMGAVASGSTSTGDIKSETIGAYSYTLSEAAAAAAGVQLATAEENVLGYYKMRGAG